MSVSGNGRKRSETRSATQREIDRALHGSRRGSKTPEGAAQQAVMDYLRMVKRWPVYRRNVGGRSWVDRKGKKRVVKFGATGQADLWGVIPEQGGRHFEIEMKAPGEEPTPEQYAWLDDMRARGCIAFWCDSVEMLERRLKYDMCQEEKS